MAKQQDTSASDVDVMLVGVDMSLAEVLAHLQPAEQALARKINPTCYTSIEFMLRRAEPDSFVNKVLAQPVIRLLEGDNHGARRAVPPDSSRRPALPAR